MCPGIVKLGAILFTALRTPRVADWLPDSFIQALTNRTSVDVPLGRYVEDLRVARVHDRQSLRRGDVKYRVKIRIRHDVRHRPQHPARRSQLLSQRKVPVVTSVPPNDSTGSAHRDPMIIVNVAGEKNLDMLQNLIG